MKKIDLHNKRFDHLVALAIVPISDKGRHVYWLCLCDCGEFTVCRGSGLTGGMHKSCGCWRVASSRARALASKASGHNQFGVDVITNQVFFPTPEMLECIQEEWEHGDLTADQIAKEFSTTKNTIIHLARRRGWESRGEVRPVPTLFTRLDAIHAKFDAAVK